MFEGNNYNMLKIPKGLIVFISGVPGVGKTTISYELLKKFNEIRIIEETDLVREILRGYNDFLLLKFGNKINFAIDKIKITDHTKLLSLAEAKEQCIFMKSSLEQIVSRQQRKGIASVINGVHIIPEILYGIANNQNIVYINLYVTDSCKIYDRILGRNPSSYMLDHIPFIFKANNDLYISTKKLSLKASNVFNINVTDLSIADTINEIANCINCAINCNR